MAIRSWTQVGLPCAKPIGIDSPGRKVLGKLPPATESRGTRSGARLLSGMAAGDQGVAHHFNTSASSDLPDLPRRECLPQGCAPS